MVFAPQLHVYIVNNIVLYVNNSQINAIYLIVAIYPVVYTAGSIYIFCQKVVTIYTEGKDAWAPTTLQSARH